MNKTYIFGVALALILGLMSIAAWYDALWVFKGNFVTTKVVAVSSTTVTTILAADPKRTDCELYNSNATYTVYLGSASVNVTQGYPLSSNTRHSPNGVYSGILYGLSQADGQCNVNVIEYLGN